MRALLPALILLSLVVSCKDPVEEKCLNLCDKMVECSIGETRPADRRIAGEMKVSCLNGCTTYQSEIMECYTPGMNCQETGKCIVRALMNQ